MKPLAAIAHSLILACAACVSSNDTSMRSTDPAAIYASDDPRADILLEIYRGHYQLTTPHRDISVPSESDSGGPITQVQTERVTYIEGLPLFAPNPGTERWRLNGFDCRARQELSEVQIDCASRDRHFRSIFDRAMGVTELDYFCGRYVDTLCRFRLISGRGVLAPF